MADLFQPQGPSFLVAANATAPSGVQIVASSNDIRTAVVRLFNDDANQTVYAGFGNSAVTAKANAQIATSSGNNSYPVAPRAESIIRVSLSTPNLWVSGITASSAQANLIVTPGSAQR